MVGKVPKQIVKFTVRKALTAGGGTVIIKGIGSYKYSKRILSASLYLLSAYCVLIDDKLFLENRKFIFPLRSCKVELTSSNNSCWIAL